MSSIFISLEAINPTSSVTRTDDMSLISPSSTFNAINKNVVTPKSNLDIEDSEIHKKNSNICCSCKERQSKTLPKKPEGLDPKLLQAKLDEQEEKLREEFKETLNKEITYLKKKFDFILENEQARASCMLREAHRERKEKIAALQQQLECKNMAGLMYVMCAERTKCKVEKMNIIETYTNYINMLTDILNDGQELILHLSRGYKTAARVDYEWKEKMKKIICEFQAYICHFSGTSPEQNQYLLDLPKLLEIEAPTEDDPSEVPIEEEDYEPVNPADLDANKEWWQLLDHDCRPFAVYGDIGDFSPNNRREALKKIKATKTAPRKWMEYMFHDMFLKSSCPNVDRMKEEYFNRKCNSLEFECLGASPPGDSKQATRRQTNQSIDLRGNMGSILKIFTTTGLTEPVPKANLLGARDSMEIASTTKLREKSKSMDAGSSKAPSTTNKIEMKIGRRTSFFDENMKLELVNETEEWEEPEPAPSQFKYEDDDATEGGLSKEHNDSLIVIPRHVPGKDHAINYEKTCPVQSCQKKHVDTFMQSLPRYMRASPYTHFSQTYEDYETCTPEQLELLKRHIEEKRKREKTQEVEFDPLLEWEASVGGIGVQTSDLSYLDAGLPPCTCRDSVHTSESDGDVYRMEDLIPVKQNLDQIAKACLWDDHIQFQRFKVVGQESKESVKAVQQLTQIKKDFTRDRVAEIQKILKQHPSLLDMFQANTRC